MLKHVIVLVLIVSSSFAFDIEKLLDKNATETTSYKDFVKKNGTASYHKCKNGIMFEISHSPYDSAPQEKMMRNIMLNPIKCEK